MYKKQCAVCGKEFEAINSRYILCSDECRKKRIDEYNKVYYSDYDGRKRKRAEKIVICKLCGMAVEGVMRGERMGRQHYHEECVVKDALQAISEGEHSRSSRIRRASNLFAYSVGELKDLMEEQNND